MTTLRDFIAARLDEDQETAEAAASLKREENPSSRLRSDYPAPWSQDGEWTPESTESEPTYLDAVRQAWSSGLWDGWVRVVGRHAARHDPARVLREVAAKRALLADITAEKHLVVDSDPYYTCLAATEERDDGKSWGHEKWGTDCNCGLDERVEQRLRFLAAPYSDHPDYREEWAASQL